MNPTRSEFNRDQVLRPYRFNLRYANDLVSDVSDDLLYHSPGPGLENHPGFALGHLVTGSAMVADHLGGDYDIPEGWDELFRRNGPGDPRLPDATSPNLPAKAALLDELGRQHGIVEQLILTVEADQFAQPVEWRFCRFFPTGGDMVAFMCVTHEAMHLAQVAAWRRACGLPSSLGRV
jgi:hypothetical protein